MPRTLKALLLFGGEFIALAMTIKLFQVLAERGAVPVPAAVVAVIALAFVLHDAVLRRAAVSRYDGLLGTFLALPVAIGAMALGTPAGTGSISSVMLVLAAGASIVACAFASAFIFRPGEELGPLAVEERRAVRDQQIAQEAARRHEGESRIPADAQPPRGDA